MKRLIRWFLQGLIVVVPVAITIFVLVWIFVRLDDLLMPLLGITTPGLAIVPGIVIMAAGITATGFLTSNILGRRLLGLVDSMFRHLPMVKFVYSSTRDFIEAFAGDKKSFDRPVVVELVAGGPLAVGFVTRQSLSSLGLDDYLAVYFPQSYNFAGSVLLCPAQKVKPLPIESSAAMAFIVSGGLAGREQSTPDEKTADNTPTAHAP